MNYKENNFASENTNKRKITIISIIMAIAFVVLIFLILFINKKSQEKKSQGPSNYMGVQNQKEQTFAVKTKIAQKENLQDYVLTNGDVETQVSLDVFPSIGGTVVQINVALGSYVRKGEVIGYVDPSEPGSYFAKSPISSPMTGSILTSPVKVGQKINASTVVTRVGDINNLQVTAKIPEKYIGDLKIGQKAEIIIQAYPDKKFMAKVVKISPVVDNLTRTKEVILNFDQKYSEVNAGMFAKVKLYTRIYQDSMIFSQDSLVENADQYYLFVVKDDNTVTKREVTLGKNVDGKYQILSGIEVGEKIVTEGMLSLYEGAIVKDVNDTLEAKPEATLQ